MFARPSQNPTQSKLLVDDLSEPPAWEESAAALSSADKKSGGSLRSIGDHDWITAVLCTLCDIVCWVALYAIAGYFRRDQFFVSPFELYLLIASCSPSSCKPSTLSGVTTEIPKCEV